MAHQTISSKHLPKHCIKAPKGFVPHRIKLQRERKAAELAAKEEEIFITCTDWQEYIEQTDA